MNVFSKKDTILLTVLVLKGENMLFNVLSIADAALYCGIIGTVVFILKTFLPIDFGAEVSGDFGSIVETDSSFALFSIESIAAFFMCSGWVGWFCIQCLHYAVKLSGLIAIICGIAGMVLYAWIIMQFRKLEHIPTAKLEELVGKSGKAYMSFAPKGTGKIQIEYNASLSTLDAKNSSEEEIKAFDAIKVVKVENKNIYIVKEK